MWSRNTDGKYSFRSEHRQSAFLRFRLGASWAGSFLLHPRTRSHTCSFTIVTLIEKAGSLPWLVQMGSKRLVFCLAGSPVRMSCLATSAPILGSSLTSVKCVKRNSHVVTTYPNIWRSTKGPSAWDIVGEVTVNLLFDALLREYQSHQMTNGIIKHGCPLQEEELKNRAV